MINELVEILHKYEIKSDKHYTVRAHNHTYLDVYQHIFLPFKYEKINLSEVGILKGESLKIWYHYFKNATIYGLDTFERGNWAASMWRGCKLEEVEDNLSDFLDRVILSQVNSCSENDDSREEFFNLLGGEKLHIIIDDASHELSDQVKTFENFIPHLHKDGIYIIEDIGLTDNKFFDPVLIKKYIPNIKIIDMRHIGGLDNVLGVYYDENSKYAEVLNPYFDNQLWKNIKREDGYERTIIE